MAKKRPIYTVNASTICENSLVRNNNHRLSDLGKATKRGIKRCTNCGTYNGTRGLICKNKRCSSLIKGVDSSECESKIDSVRLVTGNSTRVYSVHVRDRGPYYRGFVQLPFASDDNNDEDLAKNNRKVVALCFVDSCQRLFDNSILKCHEQMNEDEQQSDDLLSSCSHIESSLRSVHVAKVFETDRKVLEDVADFPQDVKSKLRQLSNQTCGVLVQQVSRSVMVVKCHVSSKRPLGYLHVNFVSLKKREVFDKYFCDCKQFNEDHVCSRVEDSKCIHYYACIWAFLSCPSLPKEFVHLVDLEVPNFSESIDGNDDLKKLKSIEENKAKSTNCDYFDLDFNNLDDHHLNNQEKRTKSIEEANEELTNVNFVEWLSSVTERINLSLSSENIHKNYENLDFQIPEVFFTSLKNRINRGSEISNQSFLSNILVTENKQVHHLYNIFSAHHLKEIFDTPQVSLCLVKTVTLDKNSIVMYLQVDRQQISNNSNFFSVEWSPNLLPTSKFGILRIKFKIGKFN